MVRSSEVRSRFAAFVAVIFAMAVLVAAGYLFVVHPGDAEGDVKPLQTSQTTSLDWGMSDPA